MEIRRKRADTRPGPRDWFTGQVWMDEIATPGPPSRVRMLSVHFAPGGRTAWHHHPFGQILHVTEGEGLVQRRGGGREPIRAGDTVQAEAGEWHWHGAGPGTFMTHLAVQEADDDGQTTYWGEHVTDDEYRGHLRTGPCLQLGLKASAWAGPLRNVRGARPVTSRTSGWGCDSSSVPVT